MDMPPWTVGWHLPRGVGALHSKVNMKRLKGVSLSEQKGQWPSSPPTAAAGGLG